MEINTKRKISLLEKLLEKSKEIKTSTSSSPEFKSWKNLVERTFVKLFGEKSVEVKQLRDLKFAYYGLMFSDSDYTQSHKSAYQKSFNTVIQSIENYIEEFREDIEESDDEIEDNLLTDTTISKIFISHSSKDKKIVEELIEILETIGMNSTQIFCSSFEGYGIEYGENFLETIKNELDNKVLVLFMLSNNFYDSPICLCEMGASWMKTNTHIPILIPPLEFKDIKGVFPLTQGLMINNSLALNQFKEQIENIFALKNILNSSTWERKRDRIINRINKELE